MDLFGKVMYLLFNMLSRLVITFLPRSKHLLISWLQSPSVVILEPPKIKSDTVSTVSPSISHEMMGPDAMTSNSEEAEVEWFYEDLQDLLELTPTPTHKKDIMLLITYYSISYMLPE